jgi:hypothetical protein
LEISLNKKRAEVRKLDDGLYKSKKEVERQAAKVSAASVSQKETELQDEARSLMVCLEERIGEWMELTLRIDSPQVLDLQDTLSQYNHHQVHAQ